MDFVKEMRLLKDSIESSKKRLEVLELNYKSHKKFTQEFLDKCGKAGITKVAIRRKHKSVPRSVDFPFGPCSSVFTFNPKGAKGINDSPLVWGVVREMGISGGCGNGDQHQISGDKLIDGVYHLKAGMWERINEKL